MAKLPDQQFKDHHNIYRVARGGSANDCDETDKTNKMSQVENAVARTERTDKHMRANVGAARNGSVRFSPVWHGQSLPDQDVEARSHLQSRRDPEFQDDSSKTAPGSPRR